MATLIDSYTESNYNANELLYSSQSKLGQSFTGNGTKLDSCKFYIYKSGTPTGNAIATLYAHTGTFGTDGTPTGAVLATSTNSIDVSTLSTDTISLKTFTFDGTYTLVNGTKYFIAIEYTGGSGIAYVRVGYDSSSPTHSGNYSNYDGSWHASSTKDFVFYVYGNTTSPIGAFPTYFRV